jgi:hypothetical protein
MVKEKWLIRLTALVGFDIVRLPVAGRLLLGSAPSLTRVPTFVGAAVVSAYWWWYRSVNEGAAALA